MSSAHLSGHTGRLAAGLRSATRARLVLVSSGAAAMAVSLLATALPVSAAPAQVGLGSADSFAVLAGSGITNTGPTTITGDIGTFPTPSETGVGSITLSGTDHAGDGVTQGAKTDLVTAYDDAAGRTPDAGIPVELGGTTVLAGVYSAGTLGLTGTLTLDAAGDPDAVFVFQVASTLITETDSRVVLLNGADPCRVVWQVGSSATFKTGSDFVGDVLAQTSITAQTSATFRGRLLARDGAVTLDTNTITGASCAGPLGGGGPGTTIAADVPADTPSPTPTTPADDSSDVPTTPTTPPTVTTGTPRTTVPPGTHGTPVPPGTPTLPMTGVNPLVPGAGFTLLGLGAVAVLAERRSRKPGAGAVGTGRS